MVILTTGKGFRGSFYIWMKDTFCFVFLIVIMHVSFTIRPRMCVKKVSGVYIDFMLTLSKESRKGITCFSRKIFNSKLGINWF